MVQAVAQAGKAADLVMEPSRQAVADPRARAGDRAPARARDGTGRVMRFYLGTHKDNWLWSPAADLPLFVSHSALADYRSLRAATCS